MIFFAPIICWYVFWKSLCKDYNMDFENMFPFVQEYMVMCAKI